MFKRIVLLVSLVVCLSSFTGCTAIKIIKSADLVKPTFEYVDHSLGDPTSQMVPIHLNFIAHNPNSIGLKNVFVSYELYSEGKSFLTGSDIPVFLVPNGDTDLVVTAEINYKDLFRAVGPLAKRILRGAKTVPVEAKVRVHGAPIVYNETEEGRLFSFSLSTTRVVDVPIPREKIREARGKVKKKLRNFKKYF